MFLLMNQTTINARFHEQIDIAFFTLRGLFYILDSSVILGEPKLLDIYSQNLNIFKLHILKQVLHSST